MKNQNLIDLQKRIQAKQAKNETDKKVLELLDCIIKNKTQLCSITLQDEQVVEFCPNYTNKIFCDVTRIKSALSEEWEPTPSAPVGEYTITIFERIYVSISKTILQERSVDLAKVKKFSHKRLNYNYNLYPCFLFDPNAEAIGNKLRKKPNNLHVLVRNWNKQDFECKFIRARDIYGEWFTSNLLWTEEDIMKAWYDDNIDVIEYRYSNNNAAKKLQLIIETVRVDLSQFSELYTIPQFALDLPMWGGKLPSNFSHIFDVK